MLKVLSTNEATSTISFVIINDVYVDGAKRFTAFYSEELKEYLAEYEHLNKEWEEAKEYYSCEDQYEDLTIEIEELLEAIEDTVNNVQEAKEKLKEIEDYLKTVPTVHSLESAAKLSYKFSNLVKGDSYQVECDKTTQRVEVYATKVQGKFVNKVVMPDVLLEILLTTDNISKYLKFWERCLANPIKYVKNNLFEWVKSNNMLITEDGFIVSYRNAILVDCLDSFREKVVGVTDFSLSYNGGDYNSESSYSLTLGKVKNPTELDRVSWSNSPVYTHWYTASVRRFFTLGQVYTETKVDINANNSCSNGVHSGNVNFGISSFGSVSLVCVVCPSKVASVPNHDCNKMRAYSLTPLLQLDTDNYSLEQYHNDLLDSNSEELNNLEALIKKHCNVNYSLDNSDSADVEYVVCEGEFTKTIELYSEERRKIQYQLEDDFKIEPLVTRNINY